MAAATPGPQPTTIQHLATAVYPSLAMLAGMQLDVFTPLKDGPLTAVQLADAIGVNAEKLSRLLYALAIAGLLTVEAERFANTPEAQHFLVKGKQTYLGGRHDNLSQNWEALLHTQRPFGRGCPNVKRILPRPRPRTSSIFSEGYIQGPWRMAGNWQHGMISPRIRRLPMWGEALEAWH